MFELKPLSPSAVPAALAKAERYRLLNEPEQSESICEDVLARRPGQPRRARHADPGASPTAFRSRPQAAGRAMELVAGLPSEYERHYYAGLVAERRARAVLSHGGMGGRARGPMAAAGDARVRPGRRPASAGQ